MEPQQKFKARKIVMNPPESLEQPQKWPTWAVVLVTVLITLHVLELLLITILFVLYLKVDLRQDQAATRQEVFQMLRRD